MRTAVRRRARFSSAPLALICRRDRRGGARAQAGGLDQADEQRYRDEPCRRTEATLSARVAAIEAETECFRDLFISQQPTGLDVLCPRSKTAARAFDATPTNICARLPSTARSGTPRLFLDCCRAVAAGHPEIVWRTAIQGERPGPMLPGPSEKAVKKSPLEASD